MGIIEVGIGSSDVICHASFVFSNDTMLSYEACCVTLFSQAAASEWRLCCVSDFS